ncbi:MAG: hypothetical protein IKE17_07545, partial [Clostridia bacterium]|nr:hypothetical protein [Clostridia bacterium]
PEQKRLPCRFAARKSPAISGKSEEDVLKGDLSPFKRAQARDKSEFTCHYITMSDATQRLMGQFYVYLSTFPKIVL